MKTGDKVRFLNSTGGGIVKGFQGKEIVLVEDEDGFEIPVLIREAVVIEPNRDAQVRSQNLPQQPETVTVGYTPPRQTKPEPEYKIEETKEGEQLTVSLVYLPIDIKNLSSTAYECYLVNDSNYYLSFNYMSKVGTGWLSRYAGLIEPNTKLFLEEFEKADLNELERICVQFIVYKKDKPYNLKNTFSLDLHIDTVKFYKLHSFKENDYFNDDALVYTLVRKDLPEKELKISAEEIELAIQEKEAPRRPRIETIKKKGKNPVIEIDLHAEELLETTAGMSAGDILEYQLTKFREAMDGNKKNLGQKLVFIHGKGDGILKNAIIKELKTKYKTAYYQDASFREYGYGATMVTIK